MKINNEELKIFSIALIDKLKLIGESEFADELVIWKDQFFTTSSEFIGELKLILQKIYIIKGLDAETRKDIQEYILLINKAFGM